MVEVARALAQSGQKWVPEIVAGDGGENGQGGSLVQVLVAQLVAANTAKKSSAAAPASDKE